MTEHQAVTHPGPPRVGDRLRAARIEHGLSLEDVAARTRIPQRHLLAIEQADIAELPAAPYAVGFVKSYARVVGLDPEGLGAQFRGEIAGMVEERRPVPSFAPADPARVPPRGLAVATLLIAIFLAIGYGLWRNGSFGGDTPDERARLATGIQADAPAGAGAQPAAAPPRAAPPAPTSISNTVAVTATEPVWVKIYDGANRLFMGEMAAGQRFEIPPSAAAPMIWTGRPQVLHVTVGATAVPPLGTADRRIKDVSLRAADLLARAQPSGSAATASAATPPAFRAAGPVAPVEGNVGD